MGFQSEVDALVTRDLGGKSNRMQAASSVSGSDGVEATSVPMPSATRDGDATVGQPGELAVRMSALRRLYELIGRLNGGRSLPDVLQSVVDGVVEGLGFSVAVVNLVHADGSFEVFAVAGSDDARSELLGSRKPHGAFDAEFAVAEHWGGLRFVPHDRIPDDAITGWIPPADAGPTV
jgi:hypothetical protein